MRGRLLLACWAVWPAATASAQDAGAVLDRAVAAFSRVSTLRADFVQLVRDPMLGTSETTSGEFVQQRPNRLAMRFRRPAGDRLVMDGQYLWVYLPSAVPGQVVRSRLTDRPGESADIVGDFLDRPRQRFTVAYVRDDTAGARAADVLDLTPRDRNGPYQRIRAWVDRSDGLVRRVEISEASGAIRRLSFANLRANVAVPASWFVFRPPAGVRVVDASR
jgi:outer membrane lipoprotein carrier protein